jgi:transcriptional regulator with XRE-family HTH domain
MLELVKLTLLRKGLSQRQLARNIGISDSQISRIILGHVRCRERFRAKIARELGVRKSDLFPPRRSRRHGTRASSRVEQ